MVVPIALATATRRAGLFLPAECGGTIDIFIEVIMVGRCAVIFPKFGARNQNHGALRADPVPCVDLRIMDRDLRLEGTVIHSPPALGYNHFVRMRPSA